MKNLWLFQYFNWAMGQLLHVLLWTAWLWSPECGCLPKTDVDMTPSAYAASNLPSVSPADLFALIQKHDLKLLLRRQPCTFMSTQDKIHFWSPRLLLQRQRDLPYFSKGPHLPQTTQKFHLSILDSQHRMVPRSLHIIMTLLSNKIQAKHHPLTQ